jgi:hypothetical protein
MEISYDGLTEAGFTPENWPSELPEPSSDNISREEIGDSEVIYRFDATVDGTDYAMEVELDTSTVPDPNEGVSFMLNQFAFLWRTSQDELVLEEGGSPRRIDF